MCCNVSDGDVSFMRWRIRGAPDLRSSSQLSMLLDGRIAHAAGLNSPADYALELKLGRPLNSKDPISLELVGKLGHLRFLVFLLLGYAGFYVSTSCIH